MALWSSAMQGMGTLFYDKGGKRMATTKEETEHQSLVPHFEEGALEAWQAWRRTLHENRHCMDCKVEIGDDEEAPVWLRTYPDGPDRG